MWPDEPVPRRWTWRAPQGGRSRGFRALLLALCFSPSGGVSGHLAEMCAQSRSGIGRLFLNGPDSKRLPVDHTSLSLGRKSVFVVRQQTAVVMLR